MALQDHQREGCVVLLGKVTCFLTDGDPQIFVTLDTLMTALTIPSASVQEAVSRCLVALFKMDCVKAAAKTYVDLLLDRLVTGATFAERHGAAMGLGGIMKSLGSKGFKEFNINTVIESSAQSSSATAREGAMLVLGTLFDSLTFIFEPYVIKFLPLLLENFSFNDEAVRAAAQDASRSVMRNLSPHGVKLVIPKVLEGIAVGGIRLAERRTRGGARRRSRSRCWAAWRTAPRRACRRACRASSPCSPRRATTPTQPSKRQRSRR